MEKKDDSKNYGIESEQDEDDIFGYAYKHFGFKWAIFGGLISAIVVGAAMAFLNASVGFQYTYLMCLSVSIVGLMVKIGSPKDSVKGVLMGALSGFVFFLAYFGTLIFLGLSYEDGDTFWITLAISLFAPAIIGFNKSKDD